ncbi:MAG: response regulator [Microcystaceae cyanobacterium]
MSYFFVRWLLLILINLSPTPKFNLAYLSYPSFFDSSSSSVSRRLVSFHSASSKQNDQSAALSWMTITVGGIGLVLGGLLCASVRRSQRYQRQLTHLHDKYCQDLTQAKADLEQEFQQKIQRLEAAKFQQNQLIDYISHELHTPLHLIQGYLRLLQKDSTLYAQQKADLSIIIENSFSLTNLLDEIREMRELETQDVTLNSICFQPKELLSDIIATLQPKSQEKGIHLQSYLASEVPQYIKADEQKLRQIWLNLLDHSLNFTDQGTITIRLSGSNQNWDLEDDSAIFYDDSIYTLLFEIEDTGKGWEEGDLHHFFEPFFIAYRTNLENQLNRGLGLFLAQQLLELMGGYLQVSSELNQGTLFQGNVMVKLPNAEEIPLSLPHQTVIGLAPDQPDYRILVVDDKMENRQLLMRLLTPLGFHLKEADNGKNALEIWSSWKPHLIFMDTRMPTMDGYETINHMKDYSQYHSTLIIAVSSGGIEAHKFELLLQNCDDILRRPFDLQTLLEKIAHHLNVKYLYETFDPELTPVSEETNTSSQLTATDLEKLPNEWKQAVYQAASAGNQRQLEEFIQQIPRTNQQLIDQLKTLVYYYNYRKIRELTQPNSNE